MATQIKELSIVISAKNRAKQELTRLNSQLGGLNKSMGLLKTAIGAVGFIYAARQALNFASATFKAADAIGKNADRIGISTDALQKYRFAFDKAGLSQAQTDKGLLNFTKNLGELRQGTGTMVTFLNKYDKSLLTSLQSANSSTDAAEILWKALGNVENQADKVALANAALGRSGKEMVAAFKNGTTVFEENIKTAERLGIVLEESLIRNAEKTNDEFSAASEVLGVQFKRAMLDLAPAISSAATALSKFLTSWAEVQKINKEMEKDTLKNRARALNEEMQGVNARIVELKRQMGADVPFGLIPQGTIDLLAELEEKLKRLQVAYKRTNDVLTNQILAKGKITLELKANIDVSEFGPAMKAVSKDYNKALDALLSNRVDSIREKMADIFKAVIDPKSINKNIAEIKGPLLNTEIVDAYRRSVENGEKAVLTLRNTNDGLSASLRDSSRGYGALSQAMSATEVKVNDIRSALHSHQNQLDDLFNGPMKVQLDYISSLKKTGAAVKELTVAENRLKEIQVTRIKESLELEKSALEVLKGLRNANLKDIEENNEKIVSLEQARADIAKSLEGIAIRRREVGWDAEKKRASELTRLQASLRQAALLGGDEQIKMMDDIAAKSLNLASSAKEGGVQFGQALSLAEDAFRKLDAIQGLELLKSKASGAGLANDAEILKTTMASMGEAIEGYGEKIRSLENLIASSNFSVVINAIDEATGPAQEIRDELESLFKSPIIQHIQVSMSGMGGGSGGSSFGGGSAGSGGSSFGGAGESNAWNGDFGLPTDNFFNDGLPEFQTSSLDLTGFDPNVGSYATGLRYVPQDGPYNLHRSEMVLNRSQAKDYRGDKKSKPPITFNINVIGLDASESGVAVAEVIKKELSKIADLERD